MNRSDNKARIKKNSEFMTPPELVNEMLDKLPVDLWGDKTKTYLDPSCGTGNFLVEVVRRKIEHGLKPLEALSTTFGIDIMPDNVLVTRYRLLKAAKKLNNKKAYETVCKNIRCDDFLREGVCDDKNFETPQYIDFSELADTADHNNPYLPEIASWHQRRLPPLSL